MHIQRAMIQGQELICPWTRRQRRRNYRHVSSLMGIISTPCVIRGWHLTVAMSGRGERTRAIGPLDRVIGPLRWRRRAKIAVSARWPYHSIVLLLEDLR